MEPAVTRSIGQGFAAANRSWVGIACYAGGWLVVAAFAVLGVMMTNPPPEVFEEPQTAEVVPAKALEAVPPVAAVPQTAGPVTVFDQMEAAPQPPAAVPSAAEIAPTKADRKSARLNSSH